MRKFLLLFLLPTLTFSQETASRTANEVNRPVPTHADISYGSHERNRLDVWIPEESLDGFPFPVVIYFHGGGFVSGDKSAFDPAPYLDAGIACVSANYRFLDGADLLSDAPFRDATRAVQFVRSNSEKWNLDPGRVALSGLSAGATMAMSIGLRDDLAAPESDDPVERQSTRANAVAAINGPTNLMPDWIVENIGGAAFVHGSFMQMFGKSLDEVLTPEIQTRIMAVSPWEFVSSDDPPIFLAYSGDLGEVPLPDTVSPARILHHPFFGKALKEKLDSEGVEAVFQFRFNPHHKSDLVDWLRTKFGMLD